MTVRAFQAVPVFFVRDVAAAIAWYRDALGWEQGFAWPDDGPPTYGSVCFGDAVIHLSRCEDPSKRRPAHAYVFTRGVDEYAEELRGRGVEFEGPQTFAYGMREIDLRDVDGNHVCFGQGLEPEPVEPEPVARPSPK